MAARIGAYDWSKTPIGPVASWSPTLRMMVRFLLANRFPLLLWWGPQYISIYNDAYCPILGAKHPWGLGKPVSECWGEIWHILQPLIDTPFKGGPPTWNPDIFLELNRHGFLEETHFTVAYSPVPDDTAEGGIGGVLATVHEITEKVVAERRVVALRDLGALVGQAKTAEEACAMAAEALAAHAKDVPFALIYLIDADRRRAQLAGATGVAKGEAVSPLAIDLGEAAAGCWPFAPALQGPALQVVRQLGARFAAVPRGPWSDAPDTAVVLAVPSNRSNEPAGLMVLGISARLTLDAYYRDFVELVRMQVATAIANARAYEEERRRAEALAELDRAKTAFFGNVSHELRTPLTLLLGPVEDVLADETLGAESRRLLEVADRNALRLQRLVNTLLDFARIEAGRVEASYVPTDLAALTAEVASVFRSAIEKAGLRLVIDCPPLAEPVHVDRDMWEKVVLNLLSNAFKHTFRGEIAVVLRGIDGRAVVQVRDTGIGIPAAELPHIFERFRRVKGARARTHEGTGIGLALVDELVRLHGGTVEVVSAVDGGTTFTIGLPLGTAHLPADRIGAPATLQSTSIRASAFVEEASRWLGAQAPERRDAGATAGVSGARAEPGKARILLADDNADMREYVERLLRQRWEVEAVADGSTALEAVRRRPPDLVLTDVMMPGLSGFELLDRLRADPATALIPVVLLSARAGEEASLEGLRVGADDYIVKPFTAGDLVTRIAARLEFARKRREVERRFRTLVEASGQTVWKADPRGADVEDAQLHPDDRGRVASAWSEAVAARRKVEIEYRVRRPDGTYGWKLARAAPVVDENGAVQEWIGSKTDVSDRKEAEAATARLAAIVESCDDAIVSKDLDGIITSWNDGARRTFGYTTEEAIGRSVTMLIPQDRLEEEPAILARLKRGERVDHFETKRRRKDGSLLDVSLTISPVKDRQGRIIGASKVARDITQSKLAARALAESNRRAEEAVRRRDELLGIVAHDLRNPLGTILIHAHLLAKSPPRDETREHHERQVAAIRRLGDRMNRLIRDLLDFAGMEAGHLPMERRRVQTTPLVRDVVASQEALARAKSLALELVQDDGAEVDLDPDRIQQVFANLIGNAIKFTPEGGRITVRSATGSEACCFWVSDTGPGIPPDLVQRVFDPYQQAKRADRQGVGLGLYIARTIVRAHGGEIGVESTGPGGTTFFVRLPRPNARAAGPSEALTAAPIHRVLVVDDDPDILRSLSLFLGSSYRVRVARDGHEALEVLTGGERTDVVILDYMMPTMDGGLFAQKMRERGMKTPILLTSASPQGREKALEIGAVDFIPKPFDFERLERVLGRVLEVAARS